VSYDGGSRLHQVNSQTQMHLFSKRALVTLIQFAFSRILIFFRSNAGNTLQMEGNNSDDVNQTMHTCYHSTLKKKQAQTEIRHVLHQSNGYRF
jgi:hypothetical protein